MVIVIGKQYHPVVVVEDMEDTRVALTVFVESLGFPVVAAADGAEALQMIREGLRPSLIITDLMMPGAHGFNFPLALKREIELADTPVVVLSAHPDAARVPASLAVATFTKPADPVALARVVRSWVTHRRAS
jgi:CheY-like chemotaxis protein